MFEAISPKILGYFHMDGKKNLADVLSKHGGFQQFWPLIKVGATWRCLFLVEDFFGLHKFQYQKKDEKESDQTIAIVQYTIQYYIYIY